MRKTQVPTCGTPCAATARCGSRDHPWATMSASMRSQEPSGGCSVPATSPQPATCTRTRTRTRTPEPALCGPAAGGGLSARSG
eukprot:9389786-Ditylum_brightwellii.AAC.1